MALYLIESATNKRSSIVIEYQIIERDMDESDCFCVDNSDKIISPIYLMNLISKYKIKVKENKLIMPNGQVAFVFRKEINRGKFKTK